MRDPILCPFFKQMAQHTSIPLALAFDLQGCMVEVKGRVLAAWASQNRLDVSVGVKDLST